jgi:dTDP-4-amino-4,6-dideoxygalactose transaminase
VSDKIPGMSHPRVHLSIADTGTFEQEYIQNAMQSGWVTTTGPDVTLLEEEVATFVGRKHAVALSSGTAALHLAYKALEIGYGDEVVIPTITFGATAFPVNYLGAKPVFIDVDAGTLTLDTNLLSDFLKNRNKVGPLPKAIVPVDLYGITCNYEDLITLSSEYEIPLVCDAAEAVGSKHLERFAGSIGECSVLSFNGNKIMTTSGGGMFLTDNEELAEKARYWSAQSREKVPWYEHKEVGYNYRLSNILAAMGRAQLVRLPEFVTKRRLIRSWYTEFLAETEGVRVLQDPPWGQSNAWLTVALFDVSRYPKAPTFIREALERENIESRPIWKPMHQQPVFAAAANVITSVADKAFESGLCLPSGFGLQYEQIQRISNVIKRELSRLQL